MRPPRCVVLVFVFRRSSGTQRSHATKKFITTGRFGEFHVHLADSRVVRLKAESLALASEWVKNISLRSSVAARRDADKDNMSLEQAFEFFNLSKLHKEGFLSKKSLSRFTKWNSLYFSTTQGGALRYYSSEKAYSADPNDFLAEIVIEPDTIIDDGVFEAQEHNADGTSNRLLFVRTRFRTFELQAPNASERDEWISTLNEMKAHVSRMNEVSISNDVFETANDADDAGGGYGGLLSPRQAKVQHDPPPEFIRKWDDDDDVQRLEHCQASLDALFETVESGVDLDGVCNACTSLIEVLDDMARECLPTVSGFVENESKITETGRIPRIDVFEFYLKFYHIRIVQELGLFLMDETYDALGTRDLLRLIDLITAYDDKLSEILRGETGEYLKDRIPPFGLSDNVEHMGELYIDKLRSTLGIWVENIVRANGESVKVQTRSDGKLITPGPADLFNLLSEALAMATSSGVDSVQAAVTSVCVVTQADYLYSVFEDVKATKRGEFEYVCAVCNDCFTILDHVDHLQEQQKQFVDFFEIDTESIRTKCNETARKCLAILHDMVMSDLKELTSSLFKKKEHLFVKEDDYDDEPVLVDFLCATLDDFLKDFVEKLERPFVSRIAKLIFHSLMVQYTTRLKTASTSEGLRVDGPEVASIVLGRELDRYGSLLRGHFSDKRSFDRAFKPTLRILEDLVECYDSSPDFLPSVMSSICLREPYLQNHVFHMVSLLIETRTDVSPSERKELVGLCKDEYEDISKQPLHTLPSDPDSLVSHPYALMFPLIQPKHLGVSRTMKDAVARVKQKLVRKKNLEKAASATTPRASDATISGFFGTNPDNGLTLKGKWESCSRRRIHLRRPPSRQRPPRDRSGIDDRASDRSRRRYTSWTFPTPPRDRERTDDETTWRSTDSRETPRRDPFPTRVTSTFRFNTARFSRRRTSADIAPSCSTSSTKETVRGAAEAAGIRRSATPSSSTVVWKTESLWRTSPPSSSTIRSSWIGTPKASTWPHTDVDASPFAARGPRRRERAEDPPSAPTSSGAGPTRPKSTSSIPPPRTATSRRTTRRETTFPSPRRPAGVCASARALPRSSHRGSGR